MVLIIDNENRNGLQDLVVYYDLLQKERFNSSIDSSILDEMLKGGAWALLYDEGFITMILKEGVYILLDIYVLPAYRKIGLAKQWIKDIENIYQPLCGAISLGAPEKYMDLTKALYSSVGYKPFHQDNGIVYIRKEI